MRALEDILEPTLRGMGFELVDLQRANGGRLLRIFIDKPGGITIDDCASTSRHLSRVFVAHFGLSPRRYRSARTSINDAR